eukprot:CAMPEP_0116890292 /NCGR_PEP_ID=MMETSP0467-20121206/831_1 /TAXON_ID=283647 /ORGANISM="Mesodinium pulex, Strain SPMC105" /LENGTH=149 /DNA_ID=CAMNT_0004557907 /DNA_START=34 /DNA_END=480 /DNA_ORIENTATION=-
MQTEEEIAAESALRENLKRKGTNSYYYAHGHGANGPEWDGKEQPRLLATAPIAAQEAEVKRTRVIESYSWMDGKKSVKILVDYENAGDVDDECLELDWTPTSVSFRMTVEGSEYILYIAPLHGVIDNGTVKKKDNKFIITLRKKSGSPW